VRVCAPRQDNRVGIQRQDRQDLGCGIGQVLDDAGRPQVPLFVLCHCEGKTVKVTVLPTALPQRGRGVDDHYIFVPDISKKWQSLGFSVRFCARRQDHRVSIPGCWQDYRVGILGPDPQDLGRGIGQVSDDAERPQVPLFVLCHCGRQKPLK
jgi:hypothetical protein